MYLDKLHDETVLNIVYFLEKSENYTLVLGFSIFYISFIFECVSRNRGSYSLYLLASPLIRFYLLEFELREGEGYPD